MRFHLVHGKNARITNNGLTALRPRPLCEFNDAIVMANRPLRNGELFEVSIDKMVGRWSGAIEAGKFRVFLIQTAQTSRGLHIFCIHIKLKI